MLQITIFDTKIEFFLQGKTSPHLRPQSPYLKTQISLFVSKKISQVCLPGHPKYHAMPTRPYHKQCHACQAIPCYACQAIPYILPCSPGHTIYHAMPGRPYHLPWSVHVAEWLVLPTSDHGVAGSNPAGGEILPKPKRRFIAQSLSCSPFHHLEMTEILLKGRKTLTHPSIHLPCHARQAVPYTMPCRSGRPCITSLKGKIFIWW